ncbi:DUF2946 domain-containing protein [Herbaspirillum sp. HC18]|nr:DUF2946 domain-containing protein [Herbaspirillum sp. HC18]
MQALFALLEFLLLILKAASRYGLACTNALPLSCYRYLFKKSLVRNSSWGGIISRTASVRRNSPQTFDDKIPSVKKLLVLFLFALLPLQFSWGVAAAYCQHEGEKTTQHFGHHPHQHDIRQDVPDDGGKAAGGHADCGYCQLSGHPPFLSATPQFIMPDSLTRAESPALLYSSHIPDGPLRPDWRCIV